MWLLLEENLEWLVFSVCNSVSWSHLHSLLRWRLLPCCWKACVRGWGWAVLGATYYWSVPPSLGQLSGEALFGVASPPAASPHSWRRETWTGAAGGVQGGGRKAGVRALRVLSSGARALEQPCPTRGSLVPQMFGWSRLVGGSLLSSRGWEMGTWQRQHLAPGRRPDPVCLDSSRPPEAGAISTPPLILSAPTCLRWTWASGHMASSEAASSLSVAPWLPWGPGLWLLHLWQDSSALHVPPALWARSGLT